MLRRLTIQDYGLVPEADIVFAGGATIFTGETGSGKTMVLGAIAFVFGERAGPDVVRRGQQRAIVSVEFGANQALRERLREDGFELDPDEEATISREVSEAGKSALRLNGRPATAGYVRELASHVVDIVGQHEAQRLLSPAYHVELLDRFAGAPALAARAQVASLFERRASVEAILGSLDRDERSAQERYAYATYAREEIEAAAPTSGEDESLTARRRLLDNAERIAGALRAAQAALAGEESSASDALGAAAVALQHVGEMGAEFMALAQSAAALQSEANDLATRAARALEEVEYDPAELEEINGRLEALDRLKRKYGGSIEAVLASLEEFRSTVDLFANADERRTQLKKERAVLTRDLDEAASRLSDLRHSAAQRLRKAIETELKELALPSARFAAQFEPLPQTGAGGAESVQFAFAANKGESQRALARVASGGELSRVLLALVVVLAGARGKTALVFDEIDAGIGGATAKSVGVRLGRLARDSQVIAVTHLAQIASWADLHYTLDKNESRNSTTISVRRLHENEERVHEVARMLSGGGHDAALEHARTLLRQTGERRHAIALRPSTSSG